MKTISKINPCTRKFEKLWNHIASEMKETWSSFFPNLITSLNIYMTLPVINHDLERNFSKWSNNKKTNFICQTKKRLNHLSIPFSKMLFSNHYHLKVLVTQSCPTLCHPMDCIAHQTPLSVGFPRQEYWSGLLFPFPIIIWRSYQSIYSQKM